MICHPHNSGDNILSQHKSDLKCKLKGFYDVALGIHFNELTSTWCGKQIT